MSTTVILISVDDDANITAAFGPVLLELDESRMQASRTMKKELETDKSSYIFFRLDKPIKYGEKAAMIEQIGGHFNYDWKKWVEGKLRTIIDANVDEDLIQVVAIITAEHERLPPREWLSELPGGKFFSKRPAKVPSNEGEPANFAASQENEETRIICDRPRQPVHEPIPIALLVPLFGSFQTNLREIDPSDVAMLFARKMARELTTIFAEEKDREVAFRELLGSFLNQKIPKGSINTYETDGAVSFEIVDKEGVMILLIEVKSEQSGTKADPSFQVSLYYLENARLVRKHATAGNEKAAGWIRARLPSVLITHAGPNIQILGGVMADRPQVEVLSPSVPMHYNVFNEKMELDLARTLTALKSLFDGLVDLDKNLPPPPSDPSFPIQHVYPYPRDFKEGDNTIWFTYVERVDPIRLVFRVETVDRIILYVKYVQRYSEEAHRRAYELGLAPKLLACEELEGGWKNIVMQPIPNDYVAADDLFSGQKATIDRQGIRDLIGAALDCFFQEGYVHGDLRGSNIFVNVDQKKVMMVDFDWAGRDGEVKYPPNIRNSRSIWRPEAELSLRPIKLRHDREMIEHL